MKMKNLRFILFALIAFTIPSCRSENDDVMCTMEFRAVTITINGNQPDEYYTVRTSTNDTIRLNRDNINGNNVYPVLDDNYQQQIQNSNENFTFIGKQNGLIMINEPFVIKADRCHIEYVSGRQVI